MENKSQNNHDPGSFLLIDDSNIPYIVFAEVFDLSDYIRYNKYNETFIDKEKAIIQSKEILQEKYYNTQGNVNVLHFLICDNKAKSNF